MPSRFRASKRPENLPGYTPVPGSARAWRTPSGAIIPRRQYLDLQASRYGWENEAEYQAASKLAGGFGGMRSAAASLAIYTALNAGLTDPAERRAFFRAHQAELIALNRDPNSVEHDKPLAQWLVALGLRDATWDFDVGDTP